MHSHIYVYSGELQGCTCGCFDDGGFCRQCRDCGGRHLAGSTCLGERQTLGEAQSRGGWPHHQWILQVTRCH